MKWLNSLDELLYEVMSWLLFFPLTLWRAAVFPLDSIREIERQALLPENEQFARLISPPLFLALGLLIAHLISVALGETDQIVARHHGLAGLVNDDTSALVLRVVLFASFALFLAARSVRCAGRPLDRQTLRQPFYAQCYPTTVFTIGLTIGTSLALVPNSDFKSVGGFLMAASLVNFFVVEVRWFSRSLGLPALRAAAHVALALTQGLLFCVAVGSLILA